ncbi:MAG: penicillin-binding protein activator LpoB [Thermoguttaceae bacterium]|nr:penicillin-binding protein activator LpoB [Thermoguttaceae bacterium]
MNSQLKFTFLFFLAAVLAMIPACKTQTGTLLRPGAKQLSGSHKAGQEVYKPLVEESVGRLLAADAQNPGSGPFPKKICFVGVENFTAEELADYKEQLYEMIDVAISSSGQYTSISRRYVEPALRAERFRMDDLFIPENQRKLQAALEKDGQPFEYLLFAKLTSGTTTDNRDSQRDYRLSLELININDGSSVKEGCDLSKAYNRSLPAKIRNRE